MKLLHVTLSLGIFLIVSTATAATRIAVVDVQRALMATEDGLSAAATLSNFTKNRQKELNRRQKELKAEENEIRKQARLLSRSALARRTEHWQRRVVSVQSKFVEYNKQLQKKQAGFTRPIMQLMFQVIARAAKKKNFNLVIDRSAVPYAQPHLDLTELVVRMYNETGGIRGAKKSKKE
jgi:outer membrane protein